MLITVDPDAGGLAPEQLGHLGQLLEKGHHVHVSRSTQGPVECWGGDPECRLWKTQLFDARR